MRFVRPLAWAVGTASLTAGLVAASASCEQIIGLEPGELRPGGGAPTTSQGAAGAGGAVGGSLPGGAGGSGASTAGAGGVAGHGGSGAGGGPAGPIQLASGQLDPVMIVTDDSFVYWTNENGAKQNQDGAPPGPSVCRVPKAGGAVEELAHAPESPVGIGLLDGWLYWAGEGETLPGSVMRLELPSGTAQAVSTTPYPSHGTPFDLAANGDVVVWTDRGLSALRVFDGASVVSSQSTGANPGLVAVDATHAYFVVSGSQIQRLVLPGGVPNVVIDAGGTIGGLFAVGGVAYWTVRGNGQDGSVNRCIADSCGSVATVAYEAQPTPTSIAVDGDDLYWINAGVAPNPGQVMHGKAAQSPATVLFAEQHGSGGLTLDADHLYWTEKSAGTVWRMRRP